MEVIMKSNVKLLNKKVISIGFLLIVLSIFNIKVAYSQFECLLQDSVISREWGPSWSCNPNTTGNFQYYGNMDNYIPYFDINPLRNPPLKTIRLNINIYLKLDSTGNYPNTEQTKQTIRQHITWINDIYSYTSYCVPSDPVQGVQEINHSKVQFDIGDYGQERIYFYADNYLWSLTGLYPIGIAPLQNAVEAADPTRMNNINVHITGGSAPTWAHASGTSWTDLTLDQWIVMFYPGNNNPNYSSATTLAHELGHMFNLKHTYCGGGATVECCSIGCSTGCNINYAHTEYLSDIFGTSPNGTCPHIVNWGANAHDTTILNANRITNNLMGGNIESCYISPKQAGQIHRALALSSARRYVNDAKSNVPLTVSNNQTWDFNFRIYRDIVINNNSTLTLQCSLFMPEFGDIIVNSGCTLLIDEDALLTGFNNNWQGTIHVKENARLIIRNGGTVKMGNNGSILVDYTNGNAGFFEYEEGANLILDSITTKLELKGNLFIDDNASFTIQGKGYILFNSPLSDGTCYNISAGSNTSFTLQGENQNHKKLEIAQPSMYMHGVKYISVANCKVVMSGSNSRLSLYRANYGSINLNNVTITSSTGNRTGHRGIALYGQTNITIQNSVFSNGLYGIHAMLNYTDGAPLTLSNCTFNNNTYGLNVNDKGITLDFCTFTNNDYGVNADGMTFLSNINSSVINYNFDGINYNSASTGGLYVYFPTIRYNYNGINYNGATKLSVRCGQVRNNTYGINFSNYSSLNMSQNETPVGGKVNMSVNTELNISATNGNLLLLNSGYNNLQRNTNKQVINGNLWGYGNCPAYVAAAYNRWNSSNTSPVFTTDYALFNSNCRPGTRIYLTDNSPTFGTCPNPTGFLLSGDNTFSSSSIINTTNYNNVSLSNALSDAVSLIENTQYFTASDRLYEILNYPFLSTSAADNYYLNKAYLYMKENMAYILQVLVSDTTLTAQNTLANHVGKLKIIQNNLIAQTQNDTNAYNRYYYASLDKALLYRAIYDYDNALLHLNNILTWVKPTNANELNKWICLTQLEKDVLDSIVRKEDFFELKKLCEYNMQLKMASDDNNETLDNEESEPVIHNRNTVEPYITVTPNPVTNQSLINVYVPDLKDDVVIRIFDVLGTLHKEIKINEIQSTIRINNSSFKDGVYQFVLSQGNTVLDNVRVVFVKD